MIIKIHISEDDAVELSKRDLLITGNARPLNEELRYKGTAIALPSIDATLVLTKMNTYLVQFDSFVPFLPSVFETSHVNPEKVELIRKNVTPTKAAPGYYSDIDADCEAVVEEFVIFDKDKSHVERVQNITVTGLDFESVLQFHSALCLGNEADALVHTF